MAEAWFYHFEGQRLEAVLPRILAGLSARGSRICVHGVDRMQLEQLSKTLWAYEPAAFIPHALATDPMPERQPLLLTLELAAPNSAAYRFFLDGLLPQVLDDMERASIFVDGGNEDQLQVARDAWRRYRAAGHSVKYWRQSESGRWEDQAVSRAA